MMWDGILSPHPTQGYRWDLPGFEELVMKWCRDQDDQNVPKHRRPRPPAYIKDGKAAALAYIVMGILYRRKTPAEMRVFIDNFKRSRDPFKRQFLPPPRTRKSRSHHTK